MYIHIDVEQLHFVCYIFVIIVLFMEEGGKAGRTARYTNVLLLYNESQLINIFPVFMCLGTFSIHLPLLQRLPEHLVELLSVEHSSY